MVLTALLLFQLWHMTLAIKTGNKIRPNTPLMANEKIVEECHVVVLEITSVEPALFGMLSPTDSLAPPKRVSPLRTYTQ